LEKGSTQEIRGQAHNIPILELPGLYVVEPEKKTAFPIKDSKGIYFDFWCYTNESNGWALHHYLENGYTQEIRGQAYNIPILELPGLYIVEPEKKTALPINDYKGVSFDFWFYTNESNGWALHHYLEKGSTQEIRGQVYNIPIFELPGLYVVEPEKKQHFQLMIIRGFILIFDATPMSQMAGHYIIMWRMVILRKSEGGQPCNIPILELPVVCVVEPDKKQHFQSMIIRGYILTFGAIPMSQMAGHDINMWRKVILGSEGNHIISLSLNSLDCV
jgi:hypothetical protein